ncbi:DUF4369 domain-containing protein [Aurantibacter crassamenti]|uniref:DUF4369 domain-containing protein n=1 Tax=Aurantibacter crassamenti TaxID=1837375 RepID=UPI00193A33FE|nr:DUF4369 domain-containing protein [Aurantibacter crassamenti]MBM1107953.1 DUF4369 domain-containing protein [Aurantibacter crassamenti]
MRKFLVLLLIAIISVSCQEENTKETMMVTGNIKGLKKGTLYLQHIKDTSLTTVDSLEISGDGNFSLQAQLESPEIFYLYLNKKDNNDINDRITFFGEPGTITINTSWNTFDTNSKIDGSATQKKWEEYQETMSQFNLKDLEIIQTARNTELNLNELQVDSLINLSEKNVLRSYLYAINFALTNSDSYIAPYIALNEVADANKIYLDSIANTMTPEVADSKYGKALLAHLDKQKKN